MQLNFPDQKQTDVGTYTSSGLIDPVQAFSSSNFLGISGKEYFDWFSRN
jgi:hypothetical protein